MSPHEFVAVLDDAIATAPRGRRSIALELSAPGGVVRILGNEWKGKFLGHEPETGRPSFGFTRRQCEEMRAVILAAAAEDAAATGGNPPPEDDTGG